jgi:lysophospholipase L1-like esterase
VVISTVVRNTKTLVLISLITLPACGGGSSSTPTGPGPTTAPGFGVNGFVFYDENRDGTPDAAERVRLPGTTVTVGGRTGQAGAGGVFTVAGVPSGTQSAQAEATSLPPYYVPGEAVTVPVPPTTGSEVAVPVVLDIGRNRANRYLAFGDSITSGVGGGGFDYPGLLAADLRAHWGEATVINAGDPGTKSYQGEGRLARELSTHRPAFTLLLYGTNDWNDGPCRNDFNCQTVSSLRSMILQARDAGSNPILGTIPPVNPAFVDRGATERNIWVNQMNDLLRTMARDEGVAIAEVHGDLVGQPSLRDLFTDHVHPNEDGYQIIARSWWNAITSPAATAAARGGRRWFGFAGSGS